MRGAHLAAILIAACSSVDAARVHQQPGEISRATRAYSSQRYILGSGEGATREIARQRAIAAIASQLRGSLWAEETIFAETGREESRGAEHAYDRESIREQILVQTSLRRIEWARVVATEEREDGRIALLAVLDRHEAADEVEAELKRLLNSLAGSLEKARNERGLLAKSRATHGLGKERTRILEAQDLLTALHRRSPSPPQELEDLSRLEAEVSEGWSALHLLVCLEEPAGSAEEATLAGRLVAKGLQASPCESAHGKEDAWKLHGTLDARVKKMQQPGGYPVFCSTRLAFRLEAEEGAPAGGGDATGIRSGGMEPREACSASMESLVDDLLLWMGAPSHRQP